MQRKTARKSLLRKLNNFPEESKNPTHLEEKELFPSTQSKTTKNNQNLRLSTVPHLKNIELNLSGVEGTCAPNGTLFVFPTSTVNSDKYNQQVGSQSPQNQQIQQVQEPQYLKQDTSTESKKLDILSLYSTEPVKPQTQNAFNNTNFMGSNLGGFNPAMYQQTNRNINYSYPMNNTTETQGIAYNGVPNYGMNGMNGMNQMGQPNYGTGYMGVHQSGYNSTAMPGFQNGMSFSVAGNVNSGYTGTQGGIGYGTTNVQVQALPNVKDANFNIQSLYGNKNM